jgi:HAUS augmin-like complex subunit 3
VGYKGRVRDISKEALGNRRVSRFLQWVVEQLVASNSLSQPELERFEGLKREGAVLEGAELRAALDKVEGSEETVDDLKEEVSCLKQSTAALKAQLQSLNAIQKSLSDHHTSLVREKESVSHTHKRTVTSYQEALHTAQEDNAKVNAALEDLHSAVDSVSSFHQPPQAKVAAGERGEEEGQSGTESTLLSYLPTAHYTSAEDHYLAELTAYTKKQFFQGIAVMAHTPGGGDTQGGVVDLDDPSNILMKGSSSEQYRGHCQELARLKALYPVVETQRVSDVLAEQYAVAVCRRAEELVTELHHQTSPLDTTLLRQHIRDKQAVMSELQSQTSQLAQEQLPGLIQEMAALQVSTVLHGDYSLKIARQDYFTSKQDKVISYLLAQTSRQELLSMLYEVELRRHRDTHRLLSAASNQLLSWRDNRDTRAQAMQSSAVLPVTDTRQTIDSRDQFATRMCSMLGVCASETTPLLTHRGLERAVGQLAQQTASLEALLSALENEQLHSVQEMVVMSGLLGRQVFGRQGSGGKPQLTVSEYEEECSKLECILSSMEQNIKKLLSDYDSKKKGLQGNQLMERERRLFVYFFTDPKQLNREVGELARRVDAMTTAKQTS